MNLVNSIVIFSWLHSLHERQQRRPLFSGLGSMTSECIAFKWCISNVVLSPCEYANCFEHRLHRALPWPTFSRYLTDLHVSWTHRCRYKIAKRLLLFEWRFKGCSTVPKIVIEIGKACSTMQKIMIEIEIVFEIMWLKSAWNKHGYYNVTGSTMLIFVIEIVIEFFRTSSDRSGKFWLKSTKNQ